MNISFLCVAIKITIIGSDVSRIMNKCGIRNNKVAFSCSV